MVDLTDLVLWSLKRDLQDLAQVLFVSYIMKLKTKHETIMTEWFMKTINHEESVAACANIIYRLKWYNEKFHETFLKNLHNDSLEIEQTLFIQKIVYELFLTCNNISDVYNRTIALIRLSFYGSGEFRKKHLTTAIETLKTMEENKDKLKLIIQLKPLVSIYDDLQIKFNGIIINLNSKMNYYFVNSHYGRILFTEQFHVQSSHSSLDTNLNLEDENAKTKVGNIRNYAELRSLFSLFAQLKDTKLIMNKTDSIDQLWANLFRDTDNQSNIEKILNIGLLDEIFLTPHIGIIIDGLIETGKEDVIVILFPYIIKPSNEVLPIVQ
ncbi:unnamed protein product [Rotaria magnacalcarata]|uniref:Uncharacterized protein n=1 Tax=Rotaria magnacalcarata TaxID=392030 RepID=A0A816B6X1_9BILA|nr:unnamed protein product [Rotaria magnacalcarata]